jgi:hypothetical protein
MAWVILAIVVVVAVAVVAFMWMRMRRSRRLQERFGPEYGRTVERTGDSRAAEDELRERAKRRDALEIRPLTPESRARFQERWRAVQARFVDEPQDATADADRLIGDAMRERGYPVEDFDQRAADVSVDHPDVVEDYRAAHRLSNAGGGDTEDLRQAMVHYRSLFVRLIESDEPQPAEVTR